MRQAVLAFSIFLALASSVVYPQSGAQGARSSADETAIRQALAAQTEAWNRGDIDDFMKVYEDSAETTFIGQNMRKGYQLILSRYKQSYSTQEQMGRLTFNDLDIRLVPSSCGKAEIALVTGKFHLERSAKGEAKKDDGIFSLVWRKGKDGWKIIMDHTS
jgi:uncharacterized protein (TIGR02246 family)